ncbi:VOC family protein [Leptobacterium flavescens]|nr:VOC family protein [Leptobacterium flavescens]
MKRILLTASTLLAFSFMACNKPNKVNPETQKLNSTEQQTTNDMKSFISIFEIPAIEFSRAVGFYQTILDIKIEEIDMQGTKMGIFPSEGQMVSGVIVKGDGYQPSADGVIIYLNGGDDLQPILDKVELNGGKIEVPKTLIDEENGNFAMFLDTEGNRIGLHSPN